MAAATTTTTASGTSNVRWSNYASPLLRRRANPYLLLSTTTTTTILSITRSRASSPTTTTTTTTTSTSSCPPALCLGGSRHRNLRSSSFLSFATSHPHHDSDQSLDKEKDKADGKPGVGDDSEEAWKQTLETFKAEALKLQGISREAYELYSQKASVILNETSQQLKVHADKARADLTVLAKEIAQGSKEYLSSAAETSPEFKGILDTYSSSADDVDEVSQLHDFHLGVPYGLLLSGGGFLSFMLTGSISAIRFGIILGGALLALSLSSLRSYKRKEPSALALKGQAVIAGIIFLRELRLFSQRASLLTLAATTISGAMVAFYLYKIKMNRKPSRESDLELGGDN